MRAQGDPMEPGGAADRLAAGVGACATRRLVAGETLFRQRDPAHAIFAVLSGRVHLVRHTSAGQRVLLHNAGPGDLLAEAALSADAYHCDATAATAAELRVIPKEALLDALRRDPALAMDLIGTLGHQVHALRARLALRGVRPAAARVLAALALHAAGQDGAVRLPGTLMDLAAEIGLSHEALYRTLAALERARKIERSGGGIRLIPAAPAQVGRRRRRTEPL